MDARDEVVLALTDDVDYTETISPSTRRIALTAHWIFRLAALLIYLFCTWFTDAFVLPFVFILFTLSLDFWVVKNISGRILVGLRWSSHVDEHGHASWVFQSLPSNRSNTHADGQPPTMSRRRLAAQANAARLFWLGLVIFPVIWFVFLLTAVFSLKLRWALVCVLAVGMSGVNLYAYIRCRLAGSGDAVASKAASFIQTSMGREVLSSLWSGIIKGSTGTVSKEPFPNPVTPASSHTVVM